MLIWKELLFIWVLDWDEAGGGSGRAAGGRTYMGRHGCVQITVGWLTCCKLCNLYLTSLSLIPLYLFLFIGISFLFLFLFVFAVGRWSWQMAEKQSAPVSLSLLTARRSWQHNYSRLPLKLMMFRHPGSVLFIYLFSSDVICLLMQTSFVIRLLWISFCSGLNYIWSPPVDASLIYSCIIWMPGVSTR